MTTRSPEGKSDRAAVSSDDARIWALCEEAARHLYTGIPPIWFTGGLRRAVAYARTVHISDSAFPGQSQIRSRIKKAADSAAILLSELTGYDLRSDCPTDKELPGRAVVWDAYCQIWPDTADQDALMILVSNLYAVLPRLQDVSADARAQKHKAGRGKAFDKTERQTPEFYVADAVSQGWCIARGEVPMPYKSALGRTCALLWKAATNEPIHENSWRGWQKHLAPRCDDIRKKGPINSAFYFRGRT
jgi:hypothetical protein